MDNEIYGKLFSFGMIIGYFFTTYFIICVLSIYQDFRMAQIKKFMRENNLLQSFADWDHKNKFSLNFVKSRK
jgi:hypothetical protein